MIPWTVDVLDERVKRELLRLPLDMQSRFFWFGGLLAKSGPQELGMPYIRPLGNKLWEMRLSGEAGPARAIYASASRQRLIILHVFVKKTQQTPDGAIAIARRRMREIPT